MAFKEGEILAEQLPKNIIVNNVIFDDPESPTDSEVGVWVANNIDYDTWSDVLLLYNPPSYTPVVDNLSTYVYIWRVTYNPAIGYAKIVRFSSTGTSSGSSGTASKWYTSNSGPIGSTGVDGDYWLQFDVVGQPNHGNVYNKIGGSWSLVGNISGPIGATGSPGASGATPNITIGTVSTIPSGGAASANITGTTPNLVLDLSIPEGDKGDPGDDADNPSFTTNVTTLGPGASATAGVTGTYPNLTLSLGIPQGTAGTDGDDGLNFSNNTSNTTAVLPNSINVFGGLSATPASPYTVYLPDVDTGLPNDGVGNQVIIVNSGSATINIDFLHGDSISPIKTSVGIGEAATYYALAKNPLNSLGYRWVTINKY